MASKDTKKKVEETIETEPKKKDSDLTLSRLDTPVVEKREPVETHIGPNNIFTVITY